MADRREVLIDGVRYVPATSAVAGLDAVMQALFESYMGDGERWDSGRTKLWLAVNEDGEGDSFEDVAVLVAEVLSRAEQGEQA